MALARNKAMLLKSLGFYDSPSLVHLKAGLDAFLSHLPSHQWQQRRNAILERIRRRENGARLAESSPIRDFEDEIGWYLLLCEKATTDPLCLEVSQSQRVLPYFAGIGERWQYAGKVKRIEAKVREILWRQRKDPDGLIFEVCVALSYAAKGWEVEFIEEGSDKSPDMLVRKGNREYVVECKRMARRTQYSEEERDQFLVLWDNAKDLLVRNGQWLWFRGEFRADISELPEHFLAELFKTSLPVGLGDQTLHESSLATIRVRQIDSARVRAHLKQTYVKAHSPALTQLLGTNWAPDNSAVTMIHSVRLAHYQGCEAEVMGSFVEDMNFACGFTRSFYSPRSIDKKARDVNKLLSDAVRQVPNDVPSIIHIAAEAMEGADVERRRTEKVISKLAEFKIDVSVFTAPSRHRIATVAK